MDFTRRKLPIEAAEKLRLCKIESVSPYALLFSPVYVFMRLNQKFVSVKAPFDFFTPEEIKKYAGFESFFLPEFVDHVEPFASAGRRVRTLLKFQMERPDDPEAMPPAPYEISDAVIQIVGALWSGPRGEIEPFFVAVFANELCDLLPEALLNHAREQSVIRLEEGVVASAWMVFLALHLGFCDLTFLNNLRMQIFQEVALQRPTSGLRGVDIAELASFCSQSLRTADMGSGAQLRLSLEQLGKSGLRVGEKIRGRALRIRTSLMAKSAPVPSVFGPEGLVDD